MKQKIQWNADVVEIHYDNGDVFRGDCASLPPEIFKPCAAARHGIAQKLGDAASGKPASAKVAEVREIWSALMAGQWNRRPGTADAEIIERAFEILAQKAGMPKDIIKDWTARFSAFSPEKQKAFREEPLMKAAIMAARAERAAQAIPAKGNFNPFE